MMKGYIFLLTEYWTWNIGAEEYIMWYLIHNFNAPFLNNIA